MLVHIGIYTGTRILDSIRSELKQHTGLSTRATRLPNDKRNPSAFIHVFAMLAMAQSRFDLVLASVYKQKKKHP